METTLISSADLFGEKKEDKGLISTADLFGNKPIKTEEETPTPTIPKLEDIKIQENNLASMGKSYEDLGIAIDTDYKQYTALSKQLDEIDEEIQTAPEEMLFSYNQRREDIANKHNELVDKLKTNTTNHRSLYAQLDKESKAFDMNVSTYNQYLGKQAATQSPDDIPEIIKESKVKDDFDAFRLGASGIWHNTKQFFNAALPNLIYADVKKEDQQYYKIQGQPVGLSDEEVKKVNEVNKEKREIYNDKYQKAEKVYDKWLIDHPELEPRQEWSKGVIETIKKDPKVLLDPGYWGYVAAQSTAFTLGIMGTTLTVTGATGNPLLGMAAGVAVAYPSQAQDLWKELVDNGATEEEASKLAVPIGAVIASVEVMGDLPLLSAVSKPFKQMLHKNITKTVAQGIVKKGVGTFLKVEAGETIEEVVQQGIQDATLMTFDKNRNLLEKIPETIVQTLIATAPLALFGVGTEAKNDINERMKRKIAENNIKTAKEEPIKEVELPEVTIPEKPPVAEPESQAPKVEKETLPKELEPLAEAKKMNRKVIKEYGITEVDESIGYITREGKGIDSSGIKQGGFGQGRNVDHREMAQAGLDEDLSGTEAMRAFMNKTGDIRVVGAKEEVNIDIPISVGMPTASQLNKIRQISKGKTIYYDLVDATGNSIKSGEGTYNTLLSDLKVAVKSEKGIKADLATGKLPKKLDPLVEFIYKHKVSKEEISDARYNRDNPLNSKFIKAMEKTGIGVGKIWRDFGFNSLGEFYDKVNPTFTQATAKPTEGKGEVTETEGVKHGKGVTLYHGTKHGFDEFSESKLGQVTNAPSAKEGFFFTDKKEVAEGYAGELGSAKLDNLQKKVDRLEKVAQRSRLSSDWGKHQKALEEYEKVALSEEEKSFKGNVKEVVLDMKNPLVKDFEGKAFQEGQAIELMVQAKEGGYDGVIFKNVADAVNTPIHDEYARPDREISNVYAVFDKNQIKATTPTPTKPVVSKKEIATPIAKEIAKVEETAGKGKVSKIAASIEAKAIEQGITKGFGHLAEFTPIVIKEQSQLFTDLVNNNIGEARSMVRGEKPIPEGSNGIFLVKAVEEVIKKTGDGELALELANSPLVSGTSIAAQTLRGAAERDSESPVKAIEDINKLLDETAKKRYPGKVLTNAKKAISNQYQKGYKSEIKKANSSQSWQQFILSIRC